MRPYWCIPTRALIIVLCAFGCICGCNGAQPIVVDAKAMAGQLKQRLPKHESFGYGDAGEVIRVSDANSRADRLVCLVQGGPTYDQDGGVGLFSQDGRMLDWRQIKGVEDHFDDTGTLRWSSRHPDSVVLQLVEDHGTGVHSDILIVLTVMDDRLVETFRGPGFRTESSPVAEERRIVKVAFGDPDKEGVNKLIWLAYRKVNGKETCEFAVYDYDSYARRFRSNLSTTPTSQALGK